MKKTVLSGCFVAVLATLSGCFTTPREKAAQHRMAIGAVNKNSLVTAMAGDAISANDPDRVKPAYALLEAEAAEITTFFNALDTRLAKVESFKTEAIGAVAGIAKLAVPSFAGGISVLEGRLQSAVTSIGEVRQEQSGQAKVVQETRDEIKDARTELAGLKQQIETKEKALTDANAVLAARIKEFQSEFSALDDKTKQEAKEAILTELASRKVVSEADLEELRNKSPEELLGLLGGGGAVAAAALAALLRTFGRSRAEGELAKLREKVEGVAEARKNVDGLQKELDELWEKHSAMMAGSKPAEASPPGAEPVTSKLVATLLSDYQARLSALEKPKA